MTYAQHASRVRRTIIAQTPGSAQRNARNNGFAASPNAPLSDRGQLAQVARLAAHWGARVRVAR